MEPGTLYFTEKTELDDEETQWLGDFIDGPEVNRDYYESIMEYTMELDQPTSRKLFFRLWQTNTGLCKTCGASEGHCDNVTCIRTRVTNKLFLWNYGISPSGWVVPEKVSS